jgi:hypothetical protein
MARSRRAFSILNGPAGEFSKSARIRPQVQGGICLSGATPAFAPNPAIFTPEVAPFPKLCADSLPFAPGLFAWRRQNILNRASPGLDSRGFSPPSGLRRARSHHPASGRSAGICPAHGSGPLGLYAVRSGNSAVSQPRGHHPKPCHFRPHHPWWHPPQPRPLPLARAPGSTIPGVAIPGRSTSALTAGNLPLETSRRCRR